MGSSLRPGLAAAVVVFVARCLLPARAEVFHFDKVPIPTPHSLTTHHVFYVYSKEDAPRRQEPASVMFRNLGANPAVNSRPQSYDGLQVSLLPFDSIDDIVSKSRFCSSLNKLLLRQTPATSHAVIHTVHFPATGKPQNAEFQINKTGRYVLAYSNCGGENATSATVTGSVLVKNPYGFLPGNEYSNLTFHGWCAFIYLVLNVLWISVYMCFWQSTVFIQTRIAGTCALCLLDSSLSWLMYKDWNSTGNPSAVLSRMSNACQLFKVVYSWLFLQQSFLGSGLVQHDIDRVTALKLSAASIFFVIQQCTWKLVMSDRHTLQLKSGFVFASALPGFLIYAVLFGWNFLALTRLLNRLKEEQKEMALARFRKVKSVLAAGVVGSCLVAALQAGDILGQEVVSWELQFLVSSGAANLVFMMVLMAMMFVWLPSEDSWKLAYAKQAAVDADEDGAGGAEEAEAAGGRPGGPGAEGSSLAEPAPSAQAREVSVKPSTVTPEPIGARGDEEQLKAEVDDAVPP